MQGVPDAILKGPLTVENLMYAAVLKCSAQMASYIDQEETADRFIKRADSIISAVNRLCRDRDGLYKDGSNAETYSQHCQIWAVLADAVSQQEAAMIMTEAIDNPGMTQCSVAMAFYLFRAVEKAGLYEQTEKLWEPWRQMLAENLTTCVEDHVGKRSDCHAWGALALYELPAVILGVRPAAPGCRKIQVRPLSGYLKWAQGEVVTPKGRIKVSWQQNPDGSLKLDVDTSGINGAEIIL